MVNIIILDIDGVLITTPSWKPDKIHNDGYSDFNENAVKNLNVLLTETKSEIWLSSSRRNGKTLEEFNEIFERRNIIKPITGYVPTNKLHVSRIMEVNSFIKSKSDIKNFLIIDDDSSLNDLSDPTKTFWIKTIPLKGLDSEKLHEAQKAVSHWA